MKRFQLKNYWIILMLSLLIAGCGEKAASITIAPGEVPTLLPTSVTIKRGKTAYVITGIGLSGTNKVAIINNKVVTPGTEVGPGMVLKDIQPTYATLQMGNTHYYLRPEDIQNELDKKKKN